MDFATIFIGMVILGIFIFYLIIWASNPYKEPTGQNGLNPIIVGISAIIALSVAYLAFDKWREHKAEQQAIKELERLAKEAEKEAEQIQRKFIKQLERSREKERENLNRFIPPRPSKSIVAPYPELSRINHEHGTVPIQITVSEYGQVVNAKLVGTSGYERLDTAALKAVKNTSFIPAKQGYNSIEHTYIINITY